MALNDPQFSGYRIGAAKAPLAVDLVGESAYARRSFDMFEESSAGIAVARADRTFAVCDAADQQIARQSDTRVSER